MDKEAVNLNASPLKSFYVVSKFHHIGLKLVIAAIALFPHGELSGIAHEGVKLVGYDADRVRIKLLNFQSVILILKRPQNVLQETFLLACQSLSKSPPVGQSGYEICVYFSPEAGAILTISTSSTKSYEPQAKLSVSCSSHWISFWFCSSILGRKPNSHKSWTRYV